jgi:hypothetical protein
MIKSKRREMCRAYNTHIGYNILVGNLKGRATWKTWE